MRRIGLFMAVVALLISAQVVLASEDSKNTITVSGSAKIEAKPDIAYITLYVKATGILMTDAAQNAKKVAAEVEKAVKEKNKDVKSFTVSDQEIGSKQSEYWGGPDQKTENPIPQVIKRLQITIPPNPDLAGNVIDAAIRAGAIMQVPSSVHYSGENNNVLVYGLSAPEEAENQARKKAIENALDNATKTAALVGREIAGVSSVQCAGMDAWRPEFAMMMARHAKYTSLDALKIEIPAFVTITYDFKK